jgi:branched-chain amino acid transport system permease protein
MSSMRFSGSQVLQALLLLFALCVPLFSGPYWVHVGTLAWYYAMLASSWALLAGYAGQFSFAHMAFAALGGYTSAILVLHSGVPLVAGIVSGIVLAAGVGALIGWLVLRLSGPYLALFTLAIAEIFHLILVAEKELTRGSLGLHVPPLFQSDSDVPYYYTGLGLVLFSLVLMTCLLRTRIGLFLRAIREDEDAAAASGVNTIFYKILVFAFTSGLAGLAGTFYGHFLGILTPTIVILPQMGLVIAMAVIGGIESLPGAVVGAVGVYVLSEMLRDYGQMRFVLLGLALILVQRFAQNGLFPLLERWLDRLFRTDRTPADVPGVKPNAAAARRKHVD